MRERERERDGEDKSKINSNYKKHFPSQYTSIYDYTK